MTELVHHTPEDHCAQTPCCGQDASDVAMAGDLLTEDAERVTCREQHAHYQAECHGNRVAITLLHPRAHWPDIFSWECAFTGCDSPNGEHELPIVSCEEAAADFDA